MPSSLNFRLVFAALLTASFLGAQSSPIPGKFYEYYKVASTSDGVFTALGAPSINDNALCAFMGQTSIGQTIWTGDGNMHPLTDINPGSGNPGSVTFSPQMQINDNNQVVARDEIQGSSSNVRLWNANATNSYTYIARAGSGQKYSGTYGGPSVNKNGTSVVAVIAGTTTELLQSGKTFAVNTGVPQPVISTNGTVVVASTNKSTGLNQISAFTGTLGTETDIADGTNFSYLDTAPGISADGNIIAFQGVLTATGATALGSTAGPGIFAAVLSGEAWSTVRLTGSMVNANGYVCSTPPCTNAAELGYNDNNLPVYFTSYPTNSRIAVVNLGLGAAGVLDDSFVVAFQGTPSSASRTNPVLGNFPLLFSSQQGLWTIRVDMLQDLSGPSFRPFPYTAIPVAQVGDQIGTGNIVASIGVNLQIANAQETEAGAIRTMRRGDHRMAFQVTTTTGAQIIYRANHLDSDQDGLLDHWETTGIDMDQDGIVDLNLAAMGANPNVRDLFLEMDWLSPQTGYNFLPAPGVITSPTGLAGLLPAMLATAPALQGTSYGATSDGSAPTPIPLGIVMHIDGGSGLDAGNRPLSYNMGSGPLNGGDLIGTAADPSALVEILYFGMPNSITLNGVTTRAFQDVKDHFFGSKDKDGRELAFKYAVLADHYEFLDSPAANHPVVSATMNTLVAGDPLVVNTDTVPDSGQYIKITAGAGAGQTIEIASVNVTTNTINLNTNFTTLPNATSTFAYISGSSGLAEVFINFSPSYNSLPGNDFMMTLGNWGASPQGFLMNACTQWRTLAHEMGHTMGLRHGGTDDESMKGTAYKSLMSYSYQLECAATSDVQGYSGAMDDTFNDFGNLNHAFPEVLFHEGNTLGVNFGNGAGDAPETEQNVADYVTQNGPIDFTKPTVAITSPVASAQVALGSVITITLDATDNVSVASVQTLFDAAGTGSPQTANAVAAGSGVYHAQYATVGGTPGARNLAAIATDTSGNIASVKISVQVINPNPAPVLASLSPSSAKHGGATFLVTINGTGFLSGCTGQWNGAARKTTFVSSTQIKMAILSTDITAAGSGQVTVANPAEGANHSNALTFTID